MKLSLFTPEGSDTQTIPTLPLIGEGGNI